MTQIIAHRGSSYLAPENTLAAVELAWREEADAVEIDVQMTADGYIVAAHDADLRRIAGIDRRIDELTLVELEAIDVGRWKDARFAGERVATLASLIDIIPAGKRLVVEVKCGEGIINELARVVAAARSPADVVLIGLSLPVMQAVKQTAPMCLVYGVIEFKQQEIQNGDRWSGAALVETARKYGMNGVDLDARGPITRQMVSHIKAAGLAVWVWTVDVPARARELIAAGVDGITTNRPGWLRSELGL